MNKYIIILIYDRDTSKKKLLYLIFRPLLLTILTTSTSYHTDQIQFIEFYHFDRHPPLYLSKELYITYMSYTSLICLTVMALSLFLSLKFKKWLKYQINKFFVKKYRSIRCYAFLCGIKN